MTLSYLADAVYNLGKPVLFRSCPHNLSVHFQGRWWPYPMALVHYSTDKAVFERHVGLGLYNLCTWEGYLIYALYPFPL